MLSFRLGELTLGDVPRVVGTVSRNDTLARLSRLKDYGCDVIEVRLDQIGVETVDCLAKCQQIEQSGLPVILTVRLSSEGGNWMAADTAREPLLSAGLKHLATIDVELQSELQEPLCAQALGLDKPIIVSYHNFDQTPELAELTDIAGQIAECSTAIPKLATMIRRQEDIRTLEALLEDLGSARPLCVLGMGPLGENTRITLPARGSCLTYGYIDEPAAPGQLPCKVLAEKLRKVKRERCSHGTDAP